MNNEDAMSILKNHDKADIEEVFLEGKHQAFLENTGDRILCVSHGILGGATDNFLMPETYPFAKWVRENRKDININVEEGQGIKDLRSGDFWMPLVLLASDVTVQMYVNLVSNYIYDMARGALKHDVKTVHLEALYKDEETKKTKKFSYSGSVEGLEKAMKKFDLNKFLKS